MKYVIILLLTLMNAVSFADDRVCSEQTGSEQITGQLKIDTNVPKWLRGATITVKFANGKETTVPAEKFKVVPRKQQYLTTRTELSKTTNCTVTKKEEELVVRRNRVSLIGGRGTQHGVEVMSSTPSQVDISSKTGFVGGAQYQFVLPILNDRFSIGAQGQTNRTFSGLIGYDFNW